MKKVYQFSALQLLVLFLIVSTTKSFAQTTYVWNKTGTADWTVDVNWTPTRTTPATNDILVFNNGAANTVINFPTQSIGQLSINNNSTVNIQAGAAANILTITGLTAGDDLVVSTGSTLNNNGTNAATIFLSSGATANISGNIDFSAAAHRIDAADANAIAFNSPAIFTQDVGCSGNVFTSSGTANAIVFNTGTTFIQKAGANPFALAQPSSKVNFKTGSLFKAQQALFLSFSGRTYSNLEIDYPSFNQSVTGVNLLTINDLTITNGTLSLNLTGGVNIKGNVSVASGQTLNFTPATAGTVSFNGSTLQTITNSGTLTFNNNQGVTFNNAAGIKINSNITFNNLVNFTSGIVTITDPAIITISATGSVAGASNSSFADGLVKKIGNTAFKFPVGKSNGVFTGYVPVEISAPALITDEYIAAYNRSSAVAISANYASGLDHVSGADYWTVNRTSGTTPVNLTLYWTNESSANGSALYINDISKLVIAHYNSSISQWDTYGATSTTGGFAAGSITLNGVNVFSPFSLGSTDISNPLPVVLNYINGYNQGTNNYLNWKVTCADNLNTTMSIERSDDGQHFSIITTVIADAIRCGQPFRFTDNDPLPGNNYYRLKITDSNGTTTYSAVIVIVNKKIVFDKVQLSPAVVKSNAVLSLTAAQKTVMNVVITDMAGKLVQKISYNLTAGSNQFTVNLSNLNAGVYQITSYTADGTSKTIRFVKQ